MTADIFAEWLQRQGQRICRTQSSYWHRSGWKAYQAFPYHWVIDPTEDEIRTLLVQQRAVAARYSSPIEAPIGAVSYHAILQSDTYGMTSLSNWARKNVRRGMERCVIEPVSFERLASEGWSLQKDTLRRQGRRVSDGERNWVRRCLAARGLPGFEAWGALLNERLCASVITAQIDGWCYMLYQQCHSNYLRDHVNNALAFRVTEIMVSERRVDGILYGLHSLDAPPSVDEFKFRMGYTAKAVRQRVVFHPWTPPAIIPVGHIAVSALHGAFPKVSLFAKLEGMIRFFREGQKPISSQNAPAVLRLHDA